MAKIHSEKLIAKVHTQHQRKAPQLPTPTAGKVKTLEDSIVKETKPRLSLEEAAQLGRDISKQFSTNPRSLEAQGSGLTEDKVRSLLSED